MKQWTSVLQWWLGLLAVSKMFFFFLLGKHILWSREIIKGKNFQNVILEHKVLVKTKGRLKTKVCYNQQPAEPPGWNLPKRRPSLPSCSFQGIQSLVWLGNFLHPLLLFPCTITDQMTKSILAYSLMHFPLNMWIQILDKNSRDVASGGRGHFPKYQSVPYMWREQV